jgi:hypothetical protein
VLATSESDKSMRRSQMKISQSMTGQERSSKVGCAQASLSPACARHPLLRSM